MLDKLITTTQRLLSTMGQPEGEEAAKAKTELETILSSIKGRPRPEWGELLRYVTDDRDVATDALCIRPGRNGDWYVSVADNADHHPTRAVRICTSGGAAAACPGLGMAISMAYAAMRESHGVPDEKPLEEGQPVFYDTLVSVRVLSEESITDRSLEDVAYDVEQGDCVGFEVEFDERKIGGREMADLLYKAGSEPCFFRLTDEGRKDNGEQKDEVA
jgi:hypothetical protein